MLVLTAALMLVPQDPIAPLLDEIHGSVEIRREVDANRDGLAALRDGKQAGVSSPAFVGSIRAAGSGALDHVRDALHPATETGPVEDAFAHAFELWGWRAPRATQFDGGDVEAFERLCDHTNRDLRRALGSGRDLESVQPRMVEAVERALAQLPDIGAGVALGDGSEREPFERLRAVDHRETLTLASRLVQAAVALDPARLATRLRRRGVRSSRTVPGGVTGDVFYDRDRGFGRFVVGGPGKNIYDCSQVNVIVDLGGDDEYHGPIGATDSFRRLAIVVDLGGDDRYEAGNDGLGSATFGIGAVVDRAGDDVYTGESRCAGFGAAGVGVFVDLSGRDDMTFGEASGGVALAGTGLFVDGDGVDVHRAGVGSFGVGLPGGLGLFVDAGGDDTRTLERRARPLAASGAVDVSFGCGAGIGALPLLSGGLGVFIDRAGDDRCAAAGLVLGVGVNGGVGVYRDDGGGDLVRAGPSSIGVGFGRGIGVVLDVSGGDDYGAGPFSFGAADSGGAAWFGDEAGDDHYRAVSPAFGVAVRAGVSAFIDRAGVDRYELGAAEIPFELAAVEPSPGAAVGLFLDDGGATDVYEWGDVEAPQPVGRIVLTSGEKPELRHRILVDR